LNELCFWKQLLSLRIAF